MPEITVIHIAFAGLAIVVGAVAGWVIRGRRCADEKAAMNAGWQGQMDAQRTEHNRLVDQNKGLMQQISQYQASHTDATNRAKELSAALKEAFGRRDELQREIKDIRGNFETAVAEREKLQTQLRDRDARGESAEAVLRKREDKIERLERELDNWQNRLPPLIERFRVRNEEAERLESDLVAARERITALEATVSSDETRVEPVDRESLGDELDASNDPTNRTQTGVLDIFSDDDEEPRSNQDDDYEFDDRYDDELADSRVATGLAAAIDDATGIMEAIDDVNDIAATLDDETGIMEATGEELDQEILDATGEAAAEPLQDGDEDDIDSDGDEVAGNEVTDDVRDEGEFGDDADDGADDGADDAESADEPAFAAHTDTHNDHEPAGGLRDNLRLIKGVGPAIEKTLNELGIFRFNQIAEMTEYDIDRVARRLKGFRSRIYREDWIGQARELYDRQADEQH